MHGHYDRINILHVVADISTWPTKQTNSNLLASDFGPGDKVNLDVEPGTSQVTMTAVVTQQGWVARSHMVPPLPAPTRVVFDDGVHRGGS